MIFCQLKKMSSANKAQPLYPAFSCTEATHLVANLLVELKNEGAYCCFKPSRTGQTPITSEVST